MYRKKLPHGQNVKIIFLIMLYLHGWGLLKHIQVSKHVSSLIYVMGYRLLSTIEINTDLLSI